MEKTTERNTEPPRTIRHTESGGHSVDAGEVLRSQRARRIISVVAKRLTLWQGDASPPGAEKTES